MSPKTFIFFDIILPLAIMMVLVFGFLTLAYKIIVSSYETDRHSIEGTVVEVGGSHQLYF